MTMQIFKNKQEKSTRTLESATDRPSGRTERKARGDDIDTLCVSSRKGLWGLLIFLGASIIAFYFRDSGLTSSFTPGFRELLGPAPPIILVNIIAGISTLSSLILIGGRIFHGWEPGNTWTHLFFRLLFYLLYFVVDALADYYHAVFISGLVVLALQHYNIWSHAYRAIDMKMTAGEGLNVWQRRVSGK